VGDPPEAQDGVACEIMEAAGCSKTSASDYRRGKRTPRVLTWPLSRPWSASP